MNWGSFTPNMLTLGTLAWAALTAGLILWLFGVAIARVAVAAAMGTLAGTAAVLLAMQFPLFISPMTAGIIGFAGGAIAGAWGFKMLQGATLALVLALAAGGFYYHAHAPATGAGRTPLAGVTGPGLAGDLAHGRLQGRVPVDASKICANIGAAILSLSMTDRQHMAMAAAGAGLIALLLALGFPRMTTAMISAVIGSLFILGAVNLFIFTHQAGATRAGVMAWWPMDWHTWGVLLCGLAVVGLAIQCRFFILRSDKPQMQPAAG